MNLIAKLTARIEEYRATNAKPCKSYGSEEAADKAGAQAAKTYAQYMTGDQEARPAEYVVFFNKAWGRWVACINTSEVCMRPNAGGYVGGGITGFFGY